MLLYWVSFVRLLSFTQEIITNYLNSEELNLGQYKHSYILNNILNEYNTFSILIKYNLAIKNLFMKYTSQQTFENNFINWQIALKSKDINKIGLTKMQALACFTAGNLCPEEIPVDELDDILGVNSILLLTFF